MPYKDPKQHRDKYNELQRKYIERNPWVRFLKNAQSRCTNRKSDSWFRYGGRGIRCLLTPSETKILWYRDCAEWMDQPSLDRIDPNGNYEMSNCRFIELSENVRLMHQTRKEAA